MTFSPFSSFSTSFTRPSLLFLSMRWMTSSSSFLPSRLRMVLPASGPGADKDIDKRGGFWYSTKVPCANDTRWCGAMAAQLICNQWVAGSTPVTSSKKSYDIPLKSGVCRGTFAFMSPTASPPFRKIMPPGGARVLKSAHHDAAVVFGGVKYGKRNRPRGDPEAVSFRGNGSPLGRAGAKRLRGQGCYKKSTGTATVSL